MLDRISQSADEFLDLIEVYYCCLALGLVGRFGVESGGLSQLNEIKDNTFRIVLSRREKPADELSPHWRGLRETGNPVTRSVPLWVWFALAAAVILSTFFWFRSLLVAQSQPLTATLASVGLEPYTPARVDTRTVVSTPQQPQLTLLGLLKASPVIDQISVQEVGNRTDIVVSFSDLFASARSDVNVKYVGLWSELANAIEQVPGRVVVVGHTDDQRLRSLRYKDNFELSRERALSVAKILSQQLSNPARVQFSGVGSSKPRFLPANLPENRAKNRRVEITHWSEQ